MTRTKKYVSRSTKNKKKTKSQTKTQTKSQNAISNITTRIIIGSNFGGIVPDMKTIKSVIESCGIHNNNIELILYNDIKQQIKQNPSKPKPIFKHVNIQIFIEHVFLEHPLEMFPSDKSYIFVNQEYIQDWDLERIRDKTVIPLCKTHYGLNSLRKLGITNAKYVGFGMMDGEFDEKINEKINEKTDFTKIPSLFIHIAGSSPLKGTKTLIDTWLTKNIKEPLIITISNNAGGNSKMLSYWKSLHPKTKDLPDNILQEFREELKTGSKIHLPKFESVGSSSIYLYNGVLDYKIIQFLQKKAEVHMCPSLLEGWGQYIDEGRRNRAVVVILDAPPINELLDNKSGILVKATIGPQMKQLVPYGWTQYSSKEGERAGVGVGVSLYTTYKTSVNDLYNGVKRILDMSLEEKRKMGLKAYERSQADYENFKDRFSKIIMDKIIYSSRRKTQNKSTLKQSTLKKSIIDKQKTLRIITIDSPGLLNDATTYKNEFIKQNYKVDIKIVNYTYNNNNKQNTYKADNTIEKYYDVNLFLETLPFKCKMYFPSKYNLFMPNNELFIDTKGQHKKMPNEKIKYNKYNRYTELKDIDIILCKTQICYKFFNFIKNEMKNIHKQSLMYSYKTVYTKFTTNIMKELQELQDSKDSSESIIVYNLVNNIDPNLFIHFAGKSGFKNTLDLVYCWIQNGGFLDIDPDIKLIITCYGDCLKFFRLNLKNFYKYDFDKDENVNMDKQKQIATYKNMTIHFKPIEPLKEYIRLLKTANMAICISNKEGYGHYINEARYLNKFIITMDYPPMNELVKDKDDKKLDGNGNGILLKKKNKFSKQIYKETKFEFYEAYPDMNELRESIIWSIKHKHELGKYGKNGREMFDDDRKYFEDVMDKVIDKVIDKVMDKLIRNNL